MFKENNKYISMTKSEFVEAINAIKEYHKKVDNIQAVLEENCEYAVLCPPSLESALVHALVDSFNDSTGVIDYFIYELKFGDKWHPGCITVHNEDFKMQTPEDLYDYLVDGLEEII